MKKIFSFLMAVTFSTALFAQAAAGTTLFSENFGGYSADDVPNGVVSAAEGSRVIYGDATVTYTSENGAGTKSGTTKIYAEKVAGGESPELLIGKKGTGTGAAGGLFSIAGIPSGGAKEITVTFKQNAQNLAVAVSGKGYSTTFSGGKPSATGERTFDITVEDGADATFTLSFQAAATSNVRFDDVKAVVKTAGEGGGEESKTQKLYLEPTSLWLADNPKFGIYAFESGKEDYFSDFMTLAADESEIYVGEIPEGYTNVIFIRLKADADAVNFDNKWNQSVDLTLEEGKDQFTVKGWDGEKGTGEWSKYAKPVLANGFYLIGQNGWEVGNLGADLLFAPNEKTVGEYVLKVNLVEGQGIKVVEVKRDVIVHWYPEGTDNEYVVDADHAGEMKEIYFNATYQDAWAEFGGYFWTAEETDVHVKSTFDKTTIPADDKVTDLEGVITWNITTEIGASDPTDGDPIVEAVKSNGVECLKFGQKGARYFKKATLSTDYFKNKNVTAVKAYMLNNAKRTGTFTAKQGEITLGSESKEFDNKTWTVLTANASQGKGGILEVTYELEQAFYIAYIEVSYEKGGTTAIDNAEESVKAVKTIENGMLIIEKAGVRYNVMGQVIR